MKIGFNLLLWTTHVTEAHYSLFAELKAAGYDGVEVPLFEGDVTHYQRIGAALRDHGLEATAVTLLVDEAHSAISPNPSHRAAAVDRLGWALDCLAAMDGRVLMGPCFQPLGVFSGQGPTRQELEWCAEVHQRVADRAAPMGIALAVEPLNRFECYVLNTMEQADAMVRLVNRPNYKATFDTFHANIEEKDPVGVVNRYPHAIGHVHISENDRGTPGRGHIDFKGTVKNLRANGYDGWLTIEAFGQALPAIQQACRIWRPLFVDEREVYTVGIETVRQAWAAAE